MTTTSSKQFQFVPQDCVSDRLVVDNERPEGYEWS